MTNPTGPLLTETERHQILVEWNNTAKDYPHDLCLHQLIEAQVERTPEAVALILGTERITYRELNARANQLAHHLRGLGVGPELLVAICMERSVEMVIGLLAVLKAGGAYVPLDPSYPKDRLTFILEDARASVLLTQGRLMSELPPHQSRVLCLDTLDTEAESGQNPGAGATARNLAYVIFTSGSTGRPKGVAIEHGSVVAFAEWARTTFTAEELAGVMFSTSICFDLSVFELFVTLSCGGKVILAANALQLPVLPAVSEVTLINTVPSAMAELVRGDRLPPAVLTVNLAGEPLTALLVDKIYQNSSVRKVYDLYGPSEDTTYSTFALRTVGGIATIGRPIANTQAYLLDEQLQPVPIGATGEVCLGGKGLARGYLNRPELTAEKFVPNPFSRHAGARLYRTGDRARYFPDGNIEFLGRLDHQVKIRGFRIELGEIEAVLESTAGVRQAVVMAREAAGQKKLVAYVAGDSRGAVSVNDMRRVVAAKLPDYMMPAAFMVMERMPLTPNGKVDRNALSAMEHENPNGEEAFVAPRTPQEEMMAKIWREVFGLKQVGVHDNFFGLGGHSLLAMQVISRLRHECQWELSLSELFKTATVAGLAAGMAKNGHAKPPDEIIRADRNGSLPLSFAQQRLWFLHQLEPGSTAYHIPMAIRLTGRLDVMALQQSLQAIIQRHEVLRTTFASVEGNPSQIIAPAGPMAWKTVDLSETPPQERETQMERLAEEESVRAFDLVHGPLIRFTLLRLQPEENLLFLVMHHIISDGWSMGVLFSELGRLYDAFSTGTPASLPALTIQYVDFARWQRHTLQGKALEKDCLYWKEKLAGAPASLTLPADHRPGLAPGFRAGQQTVPLPGGLMESVVALGRREGSTPFMTMMTALVIALHQWSRQPEFVVGTVIAGRNRREVESLIGCFMNFLPLRMQLSGTSSGLEVLLQVKATILEAQAHQDCPFEKIVEAVNPERKQNENPLYNVAFLLQNYPHNLLGSDHLQASLVPFKAWAALLDLRFIAEEVGGQMSLTCEYRHALFEGETIRALLALIVQTLKTLADEPLRKVSDFDHSESLDAQAGAARSTQEKQEIAITGTFTVEPLEESLQFWIEKLALPATITFTPYNNVFQQLLDPASLFSSNRRGLKVVLIRLEDWLGADRERNSTPASLIEESVESNTRELVRALKSAASHSSASYLLCVCPASKAIAANNELAVLFRRVEAVMADELASVRHVSLLTSAELLGRYPVADYDDPHGNELGHIPYTAQWFAAVGTMISRKFHLLNRAPSKVIVLDCDQTLWAGVCGEDGAKGIVIDPPRLALQTFMRAQHDAGMLLCLCSKNNEEDVAAVFSSHPEMPLRRHHFAGSRVNWRSKSENLKSLAEELRLDLDSFIFVDDNPVECAEVQANCPQVFNVLLPKPHLISQFLNHCWVFDHGSATAEDPQRTANYQQNQQREKFKVESAGMADFMARLDLKIRMDELTADQLSRVSQLTQRANQFNCTTRRRTESELQLFLDSGGKALTVFVSDRFGDSGLVGVVTYEETPEVLSVDTFLLSCRVLGKGVEHQMLAQLGRLAVAGGVGGVDVLFRASSKNRPALDFLEQAGNVIRQERDDGTVFRFSAKAAANSAFSPQAATANYRTQSTRISKNGDAESALGMAPALHHWIATEACSANAVLTAMESKARVRDGALDTYAAPGTEMERQLCEMWEQLLRIKRVGVQDNFFALGGHSILAVRLFVQISKLTGQNLPLVTIFQSPTVHKLASILQENRASDSLLVALQPGGAKSPLFLIHGAGGGILWGYANLAKHLAPDQPVYGIESRGLRGMEEFSRVEEMAAHYIRELRRVQPEGPYYLGGYCFGGIVAYEAARQLRACDQEVAFLGLIDAAAPNGSYDRMPWWRPSFLPRFARNSFYWLADFSRLQPEDRRDYFQRKARHLKKKLWRKSRNGSANGHSFDLDEFINVSLFSEQERKLWQIHLRADHEYVPQSYAGRVTLFHTLGQPLFCSLDPEHGWGELAEGGVFIQLSTGAHEQIFVEPHVEHLAAQFKACLAEAQSHASPGHRHLAAI
jgi:amino acid adenylation domain-containing protein/FkbH-like protein